MSTPSVNMVSTKAERVCGGCTLCCKVMGVVALAKAAGKWCQHTRPNGCGVYPQRLNDPAMAECNTYACMWLLGHFADDERPDKLKAVFTMTPHPDPTKHLPLITVSETHAGAIGGGRAEQLVRAMVRSGFTVAVRNADFITEHSTDGSTWRRPVDPTDPMRLRLDPNSVAVNLTIGGRPLG